MKRLISLCLVTLMFFNACGSVQDSASEEAQTSQNNNSSTYSIDTLENNGFYIWHKSGVCEPLYFAQATFDEGDITQSPMNDRVMWFGEDFANIPTLSLANGDVLIYHTTDVLNEEYTFERFEDFGYTVGIVGLTPTVSSRYSISTDPDDKTTFANTDADKVLEFNNDTVIIDAIGGNPLREPQQDDEAAVSPVSRAGTILGLNQDQTYEALVYDGTVKNEINLKADARPLISMEATVTSDYTFESNTIANVHIPKFLEDGYYMVNGSGIFRFLKKETSFKPDMDLNQKSTPPNDDVIFSSIYEDNTTLEEEDIEEEEGNGTGLSHTEDSKFLVEENEIADTNDKFKQSTFNIAQEGEYFIRASFEYPQGEESITADVSVSVFSPSGKEYQLAEQDDGSLAARLKLTEVGDYAIHYYGLSTRKVKLDITK